jgi:hypothetical protein
MSVLALVRPATSALVRRYALLTVAHPAQTPVVRGDTAMTGLSRNREAPHGSLSSYF